MNVTSLCVVGGRCDDVSKVVDAAENALALNGAVRYNSFTEIDDLCRDGFGVLKADSYLARDITDLSIAYDGESGLVSVTTLSPSFLLRRGNQAPLVGGVVPFVADMLEDATFAMFLVGPPLDTSHMPIEAYMGHCANMQSVDYVVSDDRWVDTGDMLVPVSVKGLKSLSESTRPYLNEIRDKMQVSGDIDPLRAIGELLIKMSDAPKEFDTMLELEYGPVYQYYWMAYSSMRARENWRDRQLRRLYQTDMHDRLVIDSPFKTTILSFSDKTIPQLVEENREYLAGKGIQLEKSDRRTVQP